MEEDSLGIVSFDRSQEAGAGSSPVGGIPNQLAHNSNAICNSDSDSECLRTSRVNNGSEDQIGVTKTVKSSRNDKNNISINEFRDTIGIYQIRKTFSDDDDENSKELRRPLITYTSGVGFLNFDSGVASLVQESLDPLEESDGDVSAASVSTEVMEILSDFDTILDNSLKCSTNDVGHEQFSNNPDNKLDHYIEINEFRDGAQILKTVLISSEENLNVIKGNINLIRDEEQPDTRESAPSTEDMDCDGMTASNDNESSNINEIRENNRRSMRLINPVPLPSAPSPSSSVASPPQELSLSARLFLESQHPERYTNIRPLSATCNVTRERGRRSRTPRRWTSLHVQPRSTVSTACTPTILSSLVQSSPFRISTPTRSRESTESPQNAEEDDNAEDAGKETWPVRGGAVLALLSCTLGAYSICRFALLTLHFGANFLLQFLILSVMFGVPLICLFASFGGALKSGPLGSWRVAPLFRGLGAALLLSQALLGAYYVAGLSWILVYLRDSFVSQKGLYRWTDPFLLSASEDGPLTNTSVVDYLPVALPTYLSEVVLRRSEAPTLPFQTLFHICLLWIAVSLTLSKGLTSFGKVVHAFTLLPVICLCCVTIRFLCISPSVFWNSLPYTNWGEFFINSKSWSAAAGECFMTWGLLAPTVWTLCGSSRHRNSSVWSSQLLRTLLPSILLTFLSLLCGVLLAGAADNIIRQNHYYYTPTSYEHASWWVFLTHERASYPRHATHHSLLLGVCVARSGADPNVASGLQPLRLATEIFPAAVALLTTTTLSSFWSIIFYGALLLLGISQLSVITWALTAGIIEICPRALRSKRGILSFACCGGLLVASVPLARGLELVHLLDYSVMGIWWHCFLHVFTLGVFFLIRGRPYAADALAFIFLSPTSSFVPLLAFTWNVVLPIAIIVECVVDFRVGRYNQILSGVGGAGSNYWSRGARVAITFIQLTPLLMVPLFSLVQCWRYLSKGPPDILDRLQLLYRPNLDENGRVVVPSTPTENAHSEVVVIATAPVPEMSAQPEDPPPLYTPPPSYSTATGARLAKLLTGSIRRSIRRIQRRLTSTTRGDWGDLTNTDNSTEIFVPLPPRQLRLSGVYRSLIGKKSKRSSEPITTRSLCTLPRASRNIYLQDLRATSPHAASQI